MGLSMRDYAEVTPFVFYEYMLPGHKEKTRSEKVELRRLGELLITPSLEKNVHFDITKYWPIAGDEEMKKITDTVLSPDNVAAMLANLNKKREEN